MNDTHYYELLVLIMCLYQRLSLKQTIYTIAQYLKHDTWQKVVSCSLVEVTCNAS